MKRIEEGAWYAFLGAALLAPFTWSLDMGGLHLTLADALLVISFIGWLIVMASSKEKRTLRNLPWSLALLPAAFLASVLFAGGEGRLASLVESGQYLLYLTLLPWLGINLVRSSRRAAILTVVMIASAVIVMLWGSLQSLFGPAEGIKAAFISPAIYGGYVALMVPVVMAISRAWQGRLGYIVAGIALLAAVSMKQPGAALALAVGLGIATVAGIGRCHSMRMGAAAFLVLLSSLILPSPHNLGALLPARGEALQPRYVEWLAGIEAAKEKPLFGLGPGNYQSSIGFYYTISGLPYPEKADRQADWYNLYILLAAKTGLVGLAAFLLMLMQFSHLAWKNIRGSDLSAALCGSLAALVIFSFFTSILVRGTGPVLGLLLLLIALPAYYHEKEILEDETIR